MSYEIPARCPYFDESTPDQGCLNRNQCDLLKAQQEAIDAERLEVVKLLTETLSHEINNPLTSVIGFTELLLKEELPRKVSDHLLMIRANAYQIRDRVKTLVRLRREQVRSIGGVKVLMIEEKAEESLSKNHIS